MGQVPANAGSLIGRRLGKYDVLALLALGGTAEIYLARIGGEAGFEKYVVVKCLHDHLADDAEFVRMFLDEARLGAQLDHSNIVQTLELGEQDGRYYMVMEYLAGMSLAMMARRARDRVPGGRLPIEMALGICAQACSGLHYAHEKAAPDGTKLNMVHRDVSPQNLVLTFDGMLKIVDFGIAKAELRETHTKSGTIKGKFAYMSPEQCLAKPLDRRTDIFALGTILHELLTGRRLFKRSSTYETYQTIVAGNVPAPSAVNHQLDPSLDDLVLKALAYDPANRYQTAEEFGEQLIRVMHQRGKSMSAGDISRFFDRYYVKEIDEHAGRMRELIEGRAGAAETLDSWDAPEGSDSAAKMPDDIDELAALAAPRPEDEIEGEATRIELNPLATVQDLHARDGEAPKRTLIGTGPSRDDVLAEVEARRAGSSPKPVSPRPSQPSRRASSVAASADAKTLLGDVDQMAPEVKAVLAQQRAAVQQGAQPAWQPQPQPTPQPLPTPPPGPQAYPRPQSQAYPQPQSQPHAQPQSQPHAPSQPYPQPQAHAPSQPYPQPQAHAPSQAYPQPQGHAPSQPYPQPQAHAPSQAYPQPQVSGFAPDQPGSDLALLASERAARSKPPWVIAVVFLAAVGVGLGITLLIGKLIS